MSTNSQEQEINVSQIGKSISKGFQKAVNRCFDLLFFIQKKFLIVFVLLVIGGGLGFYLDKNSLKYSSEIIVTPNLGGVDNLYSKIELIDSKLNEEDNLFLKQIGINKTKNIVSVKIEPVIDIYTFVNTNTAIAGNAQNTQNFELMKLFAENEDINKVIKDKITSKNYLNHKITIVTLDKTAENEIIKPILKYLNSDNYLNKLLGITKENTLEKMKKNEEQILQIDKLINQISENLSKTKNNSSLIYNNENNEINALFTLKNSLLNEIANQKIQIENIKVYVKDLSITANIIDVKGTNNKMKLISPFLFIFLYLLGYWFSQVYKQQKLRTQL
jgi:hypothetical protein